MKHRKRAFIFHICKNKKLDKGSLRFLLTWVLLGHGSEHLHVPLFLHWCALRYSLQPNKTTWFSPHERSLLVHLFSLQSMLLFQFCLSKFYPGCKVQSRSYATLLHSLPKVPSWMSSRVSAPEHCGSALALSTCSFVLCFFTCSLLISLLDCQLPEVRTATATVPVIYAVLCT